MKIDRVRKVAAVLKAVAPEYREMPEDGLRTWIELAEPYVSENMFGKMYYHALAYLAAHKMSLNIPSGNGSGGSMSVSVKDAMNVASYTEGSTSISFSSPAASAGGGTDAAEAEYLTTAYGMQFLAIRKQCVMPIGISGMKRK